jgi:excisionase family DNA binding protein
MQTSLTSSDDRPDGDGDLVNIAWVAKKLDVTPRYVRRLVAEKPLAYVKVGRLVRFERDEVYRFIRERRVAPGH